MSNAIAQSTSQVSASVSGEESYDFNSRCKTIAARKLPANGLTVHSVSIKRNSLVSALCADYRAHFAGVIPSKDKDGKTVRIPEEAYTKVLAAVDDFIEEEFAKFMAVPDELTRSYVRFVHKARQKDVLKRHTIVRDEVISLKERIFGITLFIGETKRKLAVYENQQTVWSEVTAEKVKKLEKRLVSEQETLARLEDELAQQAKITPKQ